MFKKYYDVKENAVIYMGRTSDIKAMHKSMARALRKYHTDLIPFFSDTPVFSESKITYGIVIDDDNLFYVISSDTFTAMLLDGDLVEVKEEKD